MKSYEPTSDSPYTALLDKWVPPGESCQTDDGRQCVQYDPHDWLTQNDNWCTKHEQSCDMDIDLLPVKCVKCKLDVPKPSPITTSP